MILIIIKYIQKIYELTTYLFNYQYYPLSLNKMQPEVKLDEQLRKQRKVRDTIHGFISFPKKIWHFIDSPEFQRLRNIKQLGTLYYVFPGATHTRFQHCLGVGHLAKTYMQILMQNHQEQQFGYYIRRKNEKGEKLPYIDYEETKKKQQRILFELTLAGVMHDLGHGPFSHAFDGIIIKQIQKEQFLKKSQDLKITQQIPITQDQKQQLQLLKQWSHQEASELLLDIIFKRLYSQSLLDQDDKKSIERVKQLIKGEPGPQQQRPWQFQLIANKHTGIDVDKLDYFRRDAYHLGAQQIFIDNNLLFTESRIKTLRQKQKGKQVRRMRICFPTKYAGKVIDIFHSRYQLYKYYYLNYKAGGIQAMIVDILKPDRLQYWEACKQLRKKNGQKYIKLTDYVLAQIQNRPLEEKFEQLKSKIDQLNKQGLKIKLKSNQTEQIINRLRTRDIYRLVGVFKCVFDNVDSARVAKKIFDQSYIQKQLPQQLKIYPQNISIVINKVTFGEQKKNLIQQVCLFDKEKKCKQIDQIGDGTKKQKIKNYTMLHTQYFIERVASIYLKQYDKETNIKINSGAQEFLKDKLKEKFKQEKQRISKELRQSQLKLQQNKLKLQQDKLKLQQDKLKLQQNKSNLQQDKLKLQQDKLKLDQDKLDATQKQYKQKKKQYQDKIKQYETQKDNLNEQQANKCQYISFGQNHINTIELSAQIKNKKEQIQSQGGRATNPKIDNCYQ